MPASGMVMELLRSQSAYLYFLPSPSSYLGRTPSMQPIALLCECDAWKRVHAYTYAGTKKKTLAGM